MVLPGKTVLVGRGSRRRRGDGQGAAASGDPAGPSDVDAEPLRLVADDVEAWSREGDVSDAGALREAVPELVSDHGDLDAVVANAASIAIGPLADLSPVAFERVIEVNLLGVYRTIRETLPHLLASRSYLLVVDSGSAYGPGSVQLRLQLR